MDYTIKKEKEVIVKSIEVTETIGTFAEYVGSKIIALREKHGFDHKSLLDMLGKPFSITHLKSIEKGLGTMRLRDIEILADGFLVPPYTLFTDKVEVWYSIRNGGDGSAYPIWFLTEELAEKDQEEMDEGWGEPCIGMVETLLGSNIHTKALKQ
jgi:transcriptional regulator with XRE-family HTH domain